MDALEKKFNDGIRKLDASIPKESDARFEELKQLILAAFTKGLKLALRAAVRVMNLKGLNHAKEMVVSIKDNQLYDGVMKSKEKYTLGHRCITRTLQVMLVDESDEAEELDLNIKSWDIGSKIHLDEISNPHLEEKAVLKECMDAFERKFDDGIRKLDVSIKALTEESDAKFEELKQLILEIVMEAAFTKGLKLGLMAAIQGVVAIVRQTTSKGDNFRRMNESEYKTRELKDYVSGVRRKTHSVIRMRVVLCKMPRSGIESEQWDHLLDSLEGVMLTPSEDRWSWDLNGSGEFSIASARRYIDNNRLPDISSKTRWIKEVPIKVNVHAWKVRINGLPTRWNISRRGIDIPSILCRLCETGVESSKHLFFNVVLLELFFGGFAFGGIWPPRITLERLLSNARGLGFKPRREDFPSGAKNEWGLSPKAKVRVLHTAQLDVT
nr:RNA-directed DNA polymerase, eukaryota [Tanacetum cinerariifolium]